MELLDKLVVHHKYGDRTIELYHGDLTNMPLEHAVDVLVVSALPDNYWPTRGTLIAALAKKDIYLEYLAGRKASDLRENFSCWMSQEIVSPQPGIQFKRILCFEPHVRGKPSEVVGDIFLSLMPFVVANPPITSIAMPLVATGKQRTPLTEILEPLIDAAVHWLELGLPVNQLKLVEFDAEKAKLLQQEFAALKGKYSQPVLATPDTAFKYDLFISYAHKDADPVLHLVDTLKQRQPKLSVFLDRHELNVGSAWQQEIYEALDDCHKVIAAYSPAYLDSKVCKEEFNIALLRHRESPNGTLLPIYLYSANLPSYMKLIQFIDCREGDHARMNAACSDILARLGK